MAFYSDWNDDAKIGLGIFGFLLAVILLVAGFIFAPFTIVGAGERGVAVTLGTVSSDVLDSGFHIVNPIASIHKFNVQTQKAEADASAASSDLQTVTAKVAVNYHLNPAIVTELYRSVGNNDAFVANVVTPAILDSVKAATASYTAEQLITQRAAVSDAIKQALAVRLTPYAFVESVAITNFDFSESFNQAIEAKVTAEQNALAARNLLEQKKFEAEQIIVTATADAEAIRIQAEAVQNQGGQAYIDLVVANKWDGDLPDTMLGETVPFLNLSR